MEMGSEQEAGWASCTCQGQAAAALCGIQCGVGHLASQAPWSWYGCRLSSTHHTVKAQPIQNLSFDEEGKIHTFFS